MNDYVKHHMYVPIHVSFYGMNTGKEKSACCIDIRITEAERPHHMNTRTIRARCTLLKPQPKDCQIVLGRRVALYFSAPSCVGSLQDVVLTGAGGLVNRRR